MDSFAEAGPSKVISKSSRQSASSSSSSPSLDVPHPCTLDAAISDYHMLSSDRPEQQLCAPSTLVSPRSSSSSYRTKRRTSALAQVSWWAVVSMVAILFASLVPAQVAATPNVTSLAGTWSSNGHVSTGLSFYNPINTTFTVPQSSGISYSFTDDGHWEEALYIYVTNPSKPECVSAQLIWQHGTYEIAANDSLILTAFNGDGRQQISDRCAENSDTSSYYYQSERMNGWYITRDTHYGESAYFLQMYGYDGRLKPGMWQTYNPPQMLPTEKLVVTIYGQTA